MHSAELSKELAEPPEEGLRRVGAAIPEELLQDRGLGELATLLTVAPLDVQAVSAAARYLEKKPAEQQPLDVRLRLGQAMGESVQRQVRVIGVAQERAAFRGLQACRDEVEPGLADREGAR